MRYLSNAAAPLLHPIQQESRNLRETDLPPIDLNRIPRENCPRPKTFDMVSSGVAVAEAEACVSLYL